MGRITRADVAKRAGVSPTTVSLVLNGNADRVKIAALTQERVRQAARDLNYIPSASARMLRMQSTRTIGLLLGQLPTNPYVPVVQLQLITAIRQAQQRGYFVLPVTQPDPRTPGEGDQDPAVDPYRFVRELLSQVQLAGLICETTSELTNLGASINSAGVPLVWMSLVDTPRRSDGRGHVRIHEHPGVRDIVTGLDLPATTPTLTVWGPQQQASRLQPVSDYFGENCQQLVLPDWDSASSYQQVTRYLHGGVRPRLIWCADDLLVPGVIRACEEANLQIPSDVQVVGYGDQNTDSSQTRTTTSAHWPVRELTARAVELLIDTIEGGEGGGVPESTCELRTTAHWGDTTFRRR
ncbi:MAG: LacI family DNA-binding transcriptional regulator [Actinomycetaceae bacterium]|nr:LacI family DNA-binding transcriptional regulator [Actinomycetaceae bacterium]MDU0970606.1 LacI family DNA-binding transcriptional regulator [Actinomycetaceae bacterium]